MIVLGGGNRLGRLKRGKGEQNMVEIKSQNSCEKASVKQVEQHHASSEFWRTMYSESDKPIHLVWSQHQQTLQKMPF